MCHDCHLFLILSTCCVPLPGLTRSLRGLVALDQMKGLRRGGSGVGGLLRRSCSFTPLSHPCCAVFYQNSLCDVEQVFAPLGRAGFRGIRDARLPTFKVLKSDPVPPSPPSLLPSDAQVSSGSCPQVMIIPSTSHLLRDPTCAQLLSSVILRNPQSETSRGRIRPRGPGPLSVIKMQRSRRPPSTAPRAAPGGSARPARE